MHDDDDDDTSDAFETMAAQVGNCHVLQSQFFVTRTFLPNHNSSLKSTLAHRHVMIFTYILIIKLRCNFDECCFEYL